MALQVPDFLQTKTYSAMRLRNAMLNPFPDGEGIINPDAFRVTQRGAGANMSVDVQAGAALVRGDDAGRQGLYHDYNDAVVNAVITAAHATLPRIDRVVLQIADSSIIGVSDTPTISVVAGTATAGATLDNLNGAAAVPNSALLLADVLVDAAVASIVTAKIGDRRQVVKPGIIPPRIAGVQGAVFMPGWPGMQAAINNGNAGEPALYSANGQYGAYTYFPTRIEGALKMRVTATNGAGVPSGNFNVGIYDTSGRKIAESGAVAMTGAGTATVDYSVTISSLNLDAGFYWVVIGISSGATNIPGFHGYTVRGAAGDRAAQPATCNASTGGTTLPANLTAGGAFTFGQTPGTLPRGGPILALTTS